MEVTETQNEGLKRAYKIVVSAAELEEKVNQKIDDARDNFSMKGFRKGKTPPALMKKMFGKSVLGEALQETVDGAVQNHLDESGDRPAAKPDVKMLNENWEEGDAVEIELAYERLPDIPEADFSKIKLTKLVVEPKDEEVDEALGKLAESAPSYEPRKKTAKAADGDQLVIDFNGSIDGVPFDGGAAEDYPLVLGSNSFIPGFEDQLVGVKTGEEKDVNVKFPDAYQAEALAGKDAVFAVKVKEVKEPKPAELDDELAKRFGEESMEKLREAMTTRLSTEYNQASRMVMKRELLDSLADTVDFDLPPSMVDAEAGQIAHQMWHEDNPEVEGHDHPEIETTDEHKKLAERRVRLGLLLSDVGGKNDIQVNEQEIQQAVFEQARQYPGQERQFVEFVQNNAEVQQQISAPIFEEKVVDYVFELAKVTDKKVTKKQLEDAVEKLDVA